MAGEDTVTIDWTSEWYDNATDPSTSTNTSLCTVCTCFTLHSSPPHITGASVRSCATPSILAGAAAGGCKRE